MNIDSNDYTHDGPIVTDLVFFSSFCSGVGRSIVAGEHVHIFAFCMIKFFLKSIVFKVCKYEYMNMDPFNYRSSYRPQSLYIFSVQ